MLDEAFSLCSVRITFIATLSLLLLPLCRCCQHAQEKIRTRRHGLDSRSSPPPLLVFDPLDRDDSDVTTPAQKTEFFFRRPTSQLPLDEQIGPLLPQRSYPLNMPLQPRCHKTRRERKFFRKFGASPHATREQHTLTTQKWTGVPVMGECTRTAGIPARNTAQFFRGHPRLLLHRGRPRKNCAEDFCNDIQKITYLEI